MALKADIEGCEVCGRSRCPEYDHCDNCGRPVCLYVAVHIYENGESTELWCRHCARKQGWDTDEIETQAVESDTGLSGEDIYHKEAAHEAAPEPE